MEPAQGFAARNRLWVLVLLAVVLYVPFHGMRDLWYPDEPDIAEVAQKMYESGDWIAPRRNGVIWVDYPPMLYWVGCSLATVFGGVDEWTLRMASTLGAIAVLVLVLRTAERRYGWRAALWGGLVLLTMVQFAYNAVSYRPDILFTLGFAGGLLVYARGLAPGAGRGPPVAAFALFGFAVLSKGILGLLLPGLILTLFHASRREWRRLILLAPLALVSLAIYLPWFQACGRDMIAAGQATGILDELWEQNFARFLSGEERGHGKPPFYYLGVLWGDLAPWSLFLPLVGHWLWRQRLWRERETQLLLWWAGTSLVFLSLAATKRQVYLLVAYPAFAILLGRWLAALLDREDLGSASATAAGATPEPGPARLVFRGLAVVLGLAGLAALAYPWLLDLVLARKDHSAFEVEALRALTSPVRILGVVLGACTFWLAQAAFIGSLRQCACRLLASMCALYLLALVLVAPAADPLKTYAPAGRWLRTRLPVGERHIALYYKDLGFHKMGAFAYEVDGWVELPKDEDDIVAFFDQHPTSLCLVAAEEAEPLLASTRHDWRAAIVRDDLIAGRRRYLVLRAP